jgi:hypothetical protein
MAGGSVPLSATRRGMRPAGNMSGTSTSTFAAAERQGRCCGACGRAPVTAARPAWGGSTGSAALLKAARPCASLAVLGGRQYMFPEKRVTEAASHIAARKSELRFSRHQPRPAKTGFLWKTSATISPPRLPWWTLWPGHGAKVVAVACAFNRSAAFPPGSRSRGPGQAGRESVPVVALVPDLARPISAGRPRSRSQHPPRETYLGRRSTSASIAVEHAGAGG